MDSITAKHSSREVCESSARRLIVLFANTDWYLYNFRLPLAKSLVEAGRDVLLLSPRGAFVDRLIDAGFRWREIPLRRQSLNPFGGLWAVLRLVRILRAERPSLVHSFTIKCAVYGSVASMVAGVPARVNSVAGMGYVFSSSDLKARMLRPVVRAFLRLALSGSGSRLILQNPDDVELFREAGLVNPSLIRLVPGSGVDCERFSPSTTTAASSAVAVLLPARVLWDKGVGEFVAAARLLKSEGHDARFILAGDPDAGNPASVPLSTINAWVESGDIEWLGHVEDMPALFRSVEIVVLPSYREGLPKGLIEAAACGCALITTNVPGCREVVSNRVNGLLVPDRDSEGLANAIRCLLEDPGLRVKFGAAARQNALANFDVQSVNARTMNVYREIVK